MPFHFTVASVLQLGAHWKQPSVLLLEVPQREIGGQCISWDDLLKIRQYTKERGIMMHLGACSFSLQADQLLYLVRWSAIVGSAGSIHLQCDGISSLRICSFRHSIRRNTRKSARCSTAFTSGLQCTISCFLSSFDCAQLLQGCWRSGIVHLELAGSYDCLLCC